MSFFRFFLTLLFFYSENENEKMMINNAILLDRLMNWKQIENDNKEQFASQK